MKKTSKPNPLKVFNDNKANAAKKAGATMSAFKKSLPKAQDGIIFNQSDLKKQYAANPMVGAQPEYAYLEETRQNKMGPRSSSNKYYEGYRSKNKTDQSYDNDPRFSKNIEGVNSFYNAEKNAGTLYKKGFNDRYDKAFAKFKKANPKLNTIKDK
jgi:hypothetical protein